MPLEMSSRSRIEFMQSTSYDIPLPSPMLRSELYVASLHVYRAVFAFVLCVVIGGCLLGYAFMDRASEALISWAIGMAWLCLSTYASVKHSFYYLRNAVIIRKSSTTIIYSSVGWVCVLSLFCLFASSREEVIFEIVPAIMLSSSVFAFFSARGFRSLAISEARDRGFEVILAPPVPSPQPSRSDQISSSLRNSTEPPE